MFITPDSKFECEKYGKLVKGKERKPKGESNLIVTNGCNPSTQETRQLSQSSSHKICTKDLIVIRTNADQFLT